jgi:hypothetical protein
MFLRSATPLNVVNAVCDSAGHPWIAVARDTGMIIHVFDDTAWQTVDVSQRTQWDGEAADVSWGTLSIDSHDRLFLGVIRGQAVVGGVLGDVVLFVSKDRGKQFNPLHLFSADRKLPHTGLSLERFTGHRAVNMPWVLFSTGEKGPDCFGRGIHHRVYVVQLREDMP